MEASTNCAYDKRTSTSQSKITKIKWTADEDALLIKIVEKNGPQRWDYIATFIPGRNGKQCRERWLSTYAPNLCHAEWTCNEDMILLNLQQKIGNHWSAISKYLPGRTAIMTKNRFKLLSRRNVTFSTKSNINSPVESPTSSPQTVLPQVTEKIEDNTEYENLFDTFDDTASMLYPECFDFTPVM